MNAAKETLCLLLMRRQVCTRFSRETDLKGCIFQADFARRFSNIEECTCNIISAKVPCSTCLDVNVPGIQVCRSV